MPQPSNVGPSSTRVPPVTSSRLMPQRSIYLPRQTPSSHGFPKWRAGSIHPHLHARSPFPTAKCPCRPHHCRPCFTLAFCRDSVQRGVHCQLHENRLHHHVSGPHDRLRPQMHTYRSVVNTTLRRCTTASARIASTASPFCRAGCARCQAGRRARAAGRCRRRLCFGRRPSPPA